MTEQTPQQLDPLSGITARLIVIVAGVLAVIVALAMSVYSRSQTSHVGSEIAALVVLMVTVGYFMRYTSPYRAPFTRRSLVIVFSGALLAVVLNAAAQWGSNTMVRDDWGPIAVAIVIVCLGSYRTSREILVGALIAAAVVGIVAALQSGTLIVQVPVVVYSVVAASPVLATGIAAAAFSRTTVRFVTEWRQEMSTAVESAAPDSVPPATSHLAYLEGEVIPFLNAVSAAGSIDAGDSARARVLSRELRVLMVIDADQSWAATLVDSLDDEDGLARTLSAAQRGCLRGLVANVRNSAVFMPGSMQLELVRRNGEVRGEFRVGLREGSNPRIRLAPFVAVARAVFVDAEGAFTPTHFCLRFVIPPVP
ncbi:MAG: hypothetical protein ACOH1T_03020 [Microbacteriaceae bacterium]